jgi:hypothetical protein
MTTANEIATVLDRIDSLVQNLKQEPWQEYDTTLQKALLRMLKTGFGQLQVVAKAISRVTPSATRSPGEPWFEHILDEMK